MDENRPAAEDATSAIETVRRDGARRRAVLSRVAAAVFLAASFAIIIIIPEMSPMWRLALMASAMVIAAVALILDGISSPAYRRDHLGFCVIVSSQRGGKPPGRESAARTRWLLTEAVKDHLSRNRISFQDRKPFAKGSENKPDAGIFYLENWTAEMSVMLAETGGPPTARITVGPVSADNEPALRKMMADLRTELEREFVKRDC